MMAFRDSGKSTIVGLFCAWMLLRQPDLRIIVVAADHALAKKMARNVKRVIERHPLTRSLKPRRRDQWAADQFTVNRASELRYESEIAACFLVDTVPADSFQRDQTRHNVLRFIQHDYSALNGSNLSVCKFLSDCSSSSLAPFRSRRIVLQAKKHLSLNGLRAGPSFTSASP